tara:strand:+ start:114 stop:362 length:249 start_codon:yes stop_codon:yes gene_type:complete
MTNPANQFQTKFVYKEMSDNTTDKTLRWKTADYQCLIELGTILNIYHGPLAHDIRLMQVLLTVSPYGVMGQRHGGMAWMKDL